MPVTHFKPRELLLREAVKKRLPRGSCREKRCGQDETGLTPCPVKIFWSKKTKTEEPKTEEPE
jgi:hypothetical protein